MFISGGSRHDSKRVNKVSVIGGGDLGMASVMSILSKVLYIFNVLHFTILACVHIDAQIFPFPPV